MLQGVSGDSSSVWQIFNREFLHVKGGTSVTVLFDEKKTKSKLPHHLRVKCLNYLGAVSNRVLCSHELRFIELVKEREFMLRMFVIWK